jgi:hypothetical protein
VIISQGCNDGRTGEHSQRIAEGDEAFLIDLYDDAEDQIGALHRFDFRRRRLRDGFDFQSYVLHS